MKIKGLSIEQLETALSNVNKKYSYNLRFVKGISKNGNFLNCRIRSEKSNIEGASKSVNGRNSVSASWHAHCYFFDELYDMNPTTLIYTGGLKMRSKAANWRDYNVGSKVNPCFASELSIR